ncbi:hypothetical protein [Pseudonocardia ailaonensis]|uniref:hypothetical protein n=1 Tax=Pseudonocardia ailaonensis TaxID=367279 RepID=UPI0031D92DDE
MPTEQEYDRLAAAGILEVLDQEHAVTVAELDARLSERYFERSSGNIDPHHVTRALGTLLASGVLIRDATPSRGTHNVDTIQPADKGRRATKIAQAARRKRLLAARYNGWAQGTRRHPNGLIGPAGERAVRAAILDSQALVPATTGAGEVSNLLGVELPGAADSGGFLVPLVSGIPGPTVTVLIEVKNIRSWIYPSAAELYQLLHKATVLQQARPDSPIVPVLVCRRAHHTTFKMARQLGFFVIPMSRQFAGEVDEEDVAEIRTELHFQDLVRGADASQRVADRLRKTLPENATSFAATWRTTALDVDLTTTLGALRRNELKPWERQRLVGDLRDTAMELGLDGGW